MKNKITVSGDDILAARIYLEMTQDSLSEALNFVGSTSVSRWENRHVSPSNANCRFLNEYFSKRIGADWKKTVQKDKRVRAMLRLRDLGKQNNQRILMHPHDSLEHIEEMCRGIEKILSKNEARAS